MAGLHVPLLTLRDQPRGWPRIARGRCGSLVLHRTTLAFATPRRLTRRILLPAPTPAYVLSALNASFTPIRVGRNYRLVAARTVSESGPGEAPSCGGWGREGVRSEARAQQRLAPGGRSPHNPDKMSLLLVVE